MTMAKAALFAATCLSVGQAHLSESQMSRLQRITQGDVSKSEVELVLAHFDENVSWSDPYASVRTIYCKGKPVPGCVPLENVGREGHTYLHHIVNNYNNLADWTVFSQAGAPGDGYMGHRLGGGHMQPGVQFHDYLLKDEAGPGRDEFFVFTGALQLSSLAHAMRSSYHDKQDTPEVNSARCPSNTAADHWKRLDLPPWFLSMMGQKCGVKEEGLQAQVAQYWKDYIKPDMEEIDTVFFSQGARFAVSKDRIRQRPLEEYESLLRRVEGDLDPCANYMNEWLWYYIVGKPQQSPCAVAEVVFDAPMPATNRFLDEVSGGGCGETCTSFPTTCAQVETEAEDGCLADCSEMDVAYIVCAMGKDAMADCLEDEEAEDEYDELCEDLDDETLEEFIEDLDDEALEAFGIEEDEDDDGIEEDEDDDDNDTNDTNDTNGTTAPPTTGAFGSAPAPLLLAAALLRAAA